MTDLVTKPNVTSTAIESALIRGDLNSLTTEQRVSYFNSVCESTGLNPLTRPFDYIVLNGKTVLYAKKDATDQLRKIHNVSIAITAREVVESTYVVVATATIGTRTDEAIGAVPIQGLKGAEHANAIMKAETKAKRRVTLSICGLGFLDETELETIKEVSQPLNLDNPGQYVVDLGKKYLGKKLCEIPTQELISFRDWLRNSASSKHEVLRGKGKSFCEAVDLFLAKTEPEMESGFEELTEGEIYEVSK